MRDEVERGLNSTLPRTHVSGAAERETQDPIPGLPTPPPSPVLTAPESMATVRLVDGFRLELAASEPMIEEPVALSFDEDGRAHVVEMRSYMLDIDRTGERDPISRISRLEDTDGDGRFNQSTVFVDNLILPRAVAAAAGGVLYVSDYQLYFARDTDGDGKADRSDLHRRRLWPRQCRARAQRPGGGRVQRRGGPWSSKCVNCRANASRFFCVERAGFRAAPLGPRHPSSLFQPPH